MENSLTYTMNGDYQIPDLKLTEQPEKPLGKYGRMRKAYLKEHRPLIYNQLLLTEKLYPHLIEIDETAQSRLEQMMPQLAKDAGATEQLKASDPMRWVGLMNTCKAQAEEILMAEAYSQLSFFLSEAEQIRIIDEAENVENILCFFFCPG